MVVEYRQSDGSTKIYGFQMPDGPVSKAEGQLIRALHAKCHWIERKREHRGDAVTGRIYGMMPTAYDSTEEVEAFRVRAEALHEMARQIGKPVGDPEVTEAFRASEQGGPYPHTHHNSLDIYQLRAHLRYAHGQECLPTVGTDLYVIHLRAHAIAAQQAAATARGVDPGHIDPPERDWRDQVVAEVDQLPQPEPPQR